MTSGPTAPYRAGGDPLIFALVVGAFHGLWWGLAVARASYALRLGVIVEYRTGRGEPGSGKRTRTSPSGRLERAADTTEAAALLPAGVVLPAIALIGAVDGRSWTSVVDEDTVTVEDHQFDRAPSHDSEQCQAALPLSRAFPAQEPFSFGHAEGGSTPFPEAACP
ncbi:hypothetical protein [Streptomyces sp. NPDC006510]|uniref:hypothetical protein n=1 Tax=Streptomyces sp. NPDC006510 TaxID=3155600 RepID=UPI0033A0694B